MYNLTDSFIKNLYRLFKGEIPKKVSQLENDSGFKTTDTTYGNATQGVSGLMSYTDKKKLDGIAENATNTTAVPSGLTSGYVRTGVKSGTTIGSHTTAEGYNTTASGNFCHAEGNNTEATSRTAHAEGDATIASGTGSHAEGCGCTASGGYSHAEGDSSTASGNYSHAEGFRTVAKGRYCHAEGYNSSTDVYNFCHAEGELTQANGQCSHAGGCNTIANGCCQTVIGHWNQAFGTKVSVDTMFIIGGGDNTESGRYNSFRVTKAGNVMGRSSYQSSGADYAEFFEWIDYNMKDEDRRGYFVTLEGNKIRIAEPNDNYILGIVSTNPIVLGNESSDEWYGKFKRDEFGGYIKRDIVEHKLVTGNENEKEEYTDIRYEGLILSPDFNPEKEDMYVSRSERQEWSPVGMLGQLVTRDDGTCEVNRNCVVGEGGIATLSDDDSKGWRVIERINDHLVKVLFR